ncbi:MAG TPA: TIM barrel protein [Chroococcidiopsis sp.]
MNQMWVSLSAYGGVTTGNALATLWAAGVRQVELAIGPKPSPDSLEVLQHYHQQGMQYRAHHAFVWDGQRSFNLAHKFDAHYFERLTNWLVAMDIRAYSVHAGSYARSNSPDAAYACFLKNVAQLGQLCRDRGIQFGVETMYPTPSEEAQQYLLQNETQVAQFLEDMPDIALVVDMAHLNIWRTPTISEKLQILQTAHDRILEIHISDNDGYRDTHSTIGDRTWWIPYIPLFPAHTPLVLESRMNHQSAEQVQKQIDTVQSMVAALPAKK